MRTHSHHCEVSPYQYQGKSEERERGRAQGVKHPTASRAIDALIGDEEQNGKQKRTKYNTYILLRSNPSMKYYIDRGSGEEERQENTEK